MIDLRRLHVLRAVAHYGTVTAAARALHFTPSAASQQVRQLARDLGVDLLEPQGRGVRLTPAAESLLAHADAIQARWDQAELDLRADHGAPSGVLRVKNPRNMAASCGPRCTPGGMRECPGRESNPAPLRGSRSNVPANSAG